MPTVLLSWRTRPSAHTRPPSSLDAAGFVLPNGEQIEWLVTRDEAYV